MKLAWANTIEHTGGTLLCHAFLSNFNDSTWVGDAHLMQRGNRTGLDDYLLAEWKYVAEAKLTKEEKRSDAVLISSHHSNTFSPIMSLLKQGHEFPYPIISSMRDPLLIINTWIWWSLVSTNIKLKDNKRWERQMRVNHVCGVVDNILSCAINNEKMFLFPLGLPKEVEKKNRLETFERLFDEMNTDFTDKGRKFVEEWKPMNQTKGSNGLKTLGATKEFDLYKEKIISGDKDFLNEVYDVEINMLKKNFTLQKKLHYVGYRDLPWW